MAALGASHCGPAARDVALSVVEALLQHQEDVAAEKTAAGSSGMAAEAVDAEEAEYSEVLAPHATPLLAALRAVVLAATGNTGRVCFGYFSTSKALNFCRCLAPQATRLLTALQAVVLAATATPAGQALVSFT